MKIKTDKQYARELNAAYGIGSADGFVVAAALMAFGWATYKVLQLIEDETTKSVSKPAAK